MGKILSATCSAAGIVSSSGVVVPEVEVLSEGKQESSGILFLEGPDAKYLPSSATDIKTLITNIVAILNQTIVVLTGLDAASTSPGSQAAAIVSLTTLKTQLDLTKDLLK